MEPDEAITTNIIVVIMRTLLHYVQALLQIACYSPVLHIRLIILILGRRKLRLREAKALVHVGGTIRCDPTTSVTEACGLSHSVLQLLEVTDKSLAFNKVRVVPSSCSGSGFTVLSSHELTASSFLPSRWGERWGPGSGGPELCPVGWNAVEPSAPPLCSAFSAYLLRKTDTSTESVLAFLPDMNLNRSLISLG